MSKENHHHIILQWHGHEIQWQGQEILRSNISKNSWNMMWTTVRMGMMKELQQNKNNDQTRLPVYGVLGQHASSRVDP
jgi:hypothetical protein